MVAQVQGVDAVDFDVKLRAVLRPYTVDGQLHYGVATRIVWGKPAVPLTSLEQTGRG